MEEGYFLFGKEAISMYHESFIKIIQSDISFKLKKYNLIQHKAIDMEYEESFTPINKIQYELLEELLKQRK